MYLKECYEEGKKSVFQSFKLSLQLNDALNQKVKYIQLYYSGSCQINVATHENLCIKKQCEGIDCPHANQAITQLGRDNQWMTRVSNGDLVHGLEACQEVEHLVRVTAVGTSLTELCISSFSYTMRCIFKTWL